MCLQNTGFLFLRSTVEIAPVVLLSLPRNLTAFLVKCRLNGQTFCEEILSLTDTVTSFLDVTKGAIDILYLEFPKIITAFLQKRTMYGNVRTILAWLRDNRKGRKHHVVVNKLCCGSLGTPSRC